MSGSEAFLDKVAHFLYCPTMRGARSARARWHHRVHLIPGWLLARICDRYDRWLGVTESEMARTSGDFYEDDEPVGEVLAAFERGTKVRTGRPVGWYCPHYSMTFGGLAMDTPPTYSLCNCRMQPIYEGSR